MDYFTKWIEAEALATITIQKAVNFVWNNIVCRFGVPRILISDNGKQFDYDKFKEFTSGLNINHRFSLISHP